MSLLEDYLKDLNKLETAKTRDGKKLTRIRSIDFVKGFAISLIILCHTSGAWLDPFWVYAYGQVYQFLDVFGPSLFIFLSALSVVFSIQKKSGKVPEKVIRLNIFIRGISIMLIGVVYNLISLSTTVEVPFPLNLWGWNILTFIGAAQIITYYVLRLSRGSRIGIGLIIVFLTPQIRDFLYSNRADPIVAILHYIAVSPAPHNPFFPYVAICFFSSIFGELFFEAMIIETRETHMDTFRTFMKWGAFFTLLGIFMPFIDGGPIFVTPAAPFIVEEYPFVILVPTMQDQPFIYIPGMLKFLLRGTPANLFYSLGMALLILGASFYYIDIRDNDNSFIKMLIFYGQISLTLFLLHYLWLTAYYRTLSIAFFFFVWVGFLGFLGFFMYIWRKEWGGKYSLEWIMTQMGGKKKGPPPEKPILESESPNPRS
jgi:uncharacterized membrane protein